MAGGGGGLGQLASPGAAGPQQGGGGLQRLQMPDATSGGPTPLGAPGDTAPDNRSAPMGAPQGRGPMAELEAQHSYAKAVFDQIQKSRNMLDHMRREMDQLTAKGDTVDPSDVIAAAGRVVGHGVNAHEMAAILADMPPAGGQGLAAWLAAHDVAINQQENHADQVLSIAGSRMAAAGLRILAGHHVAARAAQAQRGGPLAPRGQGQGARPVAAPPGTATGAGGLGQTNVIQTEQRPQMEGPAAEEAV